MLPQAAPAGAPKSNSVVLKVAVSDGTHRQWVGAELRHRFDLECVETADELRDLPSGVTRNGLIKQGGRRHEKDDRAGIDDTRNWVLGADTKAKVTGLQDEADSLDAQLGGVRQQLQKLDERNRN
jgi:uncharacterized protein YPO0396